MKKTDIESAIQLLKIHNYEIQSVNEWAQLSGISRSYFSRLVKKHTGHTALELIHNQRLKNIIDMKLNHEDFKLSYIASECGFQNEQALYKFVKGQLGIPPSHLGKKHKKHIKLPSTPIKNK